MIEDSSSVDRDRNPSSTHFDDADHRISLETIQRQSALRYRQAPGGDVRPPPYEKLLGRDKCTKLQ